MAASPLAVVLLSGGLDSATTLAVARQQGFQPAALTCHYGQRHQVEVAAARRVARHQGVDQHLVVELDLSRFSRSALTGQLAVPKHATVEEIGSAIPVTYVPARNTVFLAIALAWAEVLGTGDIFIGVNALDYSGYPDCRPAFIEAFERMANLATQAAVEHRLPVHLHAPLIHLTKAEIIAWGLRLGVDYGLTTSCYDPSADGLACGHCDACLLRQRGFREAGVHDPVPYAP